jgi:electron transfer flavoprotein alpha subunit
MPSSSALVLVEHSNGELSSISKELLSAARRLADASSETVTAVAFGRGASEAAREAIAHGADSALVAEDAALDEYANDTWTAALSAAAAETNPSIVLLGQTNIGRDLAPRFATRAGSAAAMDCIDLGLRDGRLLMTRPCYGGNAHAQYTCRTDPQVATLRAKAFEPLQPDASRSGEVKTLSLGVTASVARTIARDVVESEGVRLEDAAVVVSGGRGMGGAEAFDELRMLARVLGAAVGSSRAAVDAGWVPVASQVGLTGKVVTPELYIAFGISGASQHLAGITGARNVVAVNKDKDAEIFKVARYGAVADWKAFLPAFTEECRKLKN